MRIESMTEALFAVIGIISLATIIGVVFQITRQLFAIMAYFTYAGLIYLEAMLPMRLYIPLKGEKRIFMDACASVLTTISLQSIWVFLKIRNETFVEQLPKYISLITVLIGIVCLVVIYYISSKSKPNDHKEEPWIEKLTSLTIPKIIRFWE